MKKKFLKKTLLLFINILVLNIVHAQDINIDLQNLRDNYETDFSKDFKISFTNGQKLGVILKNDNPIPAILKEEVDLTNVVLKFTVAAGVVIIKDKDNKDVKITKASFEIDLGDHIAFKVSKSNNLLVDVSKLQKDYKADYKSGFTIAFVNSDKKAKKISLITGSGATAKTTILDPAADVTKFTMPFIAKDGSLIIKDKKDKEVKIDESPFTIAIDAKKFTVTNNPVAPITGRSATQTNTNSNEAKTERTPYWSYLKKENKLNFSLQRLMLAADGKCCDDCTDCTDDAFVGNNRIIYNARSGQTYFVPADVVINDKLCKPDDIKKYKDYIVNHKNKVTLSAGERLVYIVENVNPALYNIELSDSALLTNNNSNGLLESLLLQKSENSVSASSTDVTRINGGDDEDKEMKLADEQEYLKIKTGMLLVKAEMERLLQNLRRSSPYLNNCIQANKRKALKEIDKYTSQLLMYNNAANTYKDYSFIQLADIFLNQETEDSVLNHQIKVLYGEFEAASFKIAFPYTVPEQDMLTFRLSITAKPNCPYPSLLNVKSKDPTETVYIKNFFKVDVSSGLYLGFMKDKTFTLQSDTLTIRNVANTADSLTNVKRIVPEDDGKNEIGFASFLHLYYKYSKWCNLGATIGAGISFDKIVRPRYFTGISLLLGTNNRLCINGGIVWGNYQDLSNQYKKIGNDYKVLKDTETSLNYASNFKHTGFVSISYNIPFLKRKNTDAKPKESGETSTNSGSSGTSTSNSGTKSGS